PWAELARAVPDLSVEEGFFGCVYVAWGRLPGDAGAAVVPAAEVEAAEAEVTEPEVTEPPELPWHVDLADLPGLAGRHLGYSSWHDILQRDRTGSACLTPH